MKIEVVVNKTDPEKKRGDLLEKIAKELLEIQNYEVETEIKKTGMELDLLCRNKANPSRKIYVECKAYCEQNKINADIVKNLVGIRGIEKYEDAWLITTSELGKEAKGLIDKIQSSDDSKYFTFYTPSKLIEAFINAKVIKSSEVARMRIVDVIKKEKLSSDFMLLITEYGYFWVAKLLHGGKPDGVIFVHADTGEIVKERLLLSNLANTDNSFSELKFEEIYNFIEDKQDYQKLSVRDLKLSIEYLVRIDDIGMKITHPNKENLFLSDMFVYPDLENIEDKEAPKMNSKNLLKLENEYRKCLILGDDVSGKTSLALTLQKSINTIEAIPLYIKAEDIKGSDFNKFSNVLIREFEKQYSKDKQYVEVFKSIIDKDRSKIVLFIDDFESLGIKREKAKLSFFEMLTEKFENIFIFANSSLEIEVVAKNEMNEMLHNFKILKIKQLGFVLKDDLIEKWLTVGNEEVITDGEVLNRKNEITNKVNTACGVNFIPTYPLYIITILQLLEAGSPLKLQGSSYAELYQYLIDKALGSANAKNEDFDFFNTYLSYVAYYFFVEHKKELLEEDMIEMYTKYSEKMEISNDFDIVHNLLTKAKILRKENGGYRFNHNYLYYFFVAKYLSDNMVENEEIRNEIDKIIERLHQGESANIIIFLIHHSKNKNIIDRIIKKSEELFNEIMPYTLSDKETDKINILIQGEIKILIDDKSPTEHRKEALEIQDKFDDENERERIKVSSSEPEYEDEEIDLDLFGKINLSFKLMEILGQIAKNYYGSLDGIKKGEILGETYSVGFRSLHAFLENFEKYIETIKNCAEELLDKKGNITKEDKEKVENEIVYSFMEMIVFLYVKKISDSVASKNLFISIDKLEEKNDNPSTKIVNMSVKLNFPNGINTKKICALDQELDKNYLTKRILRLLVVEHLYKFDVDHAEKQRICDKLGIEINHKALITKKMTNR